MKPLFKSRFQMKPYGERNHTEIAAEAFADIRRWVEDHEIDGEHPVPLRVAEIVRHRDRPYQIREIELPAGEFHKSVYWTHPAEKESGRWWTVQADLVYCDGTLEFQFVLGIEAESLADAPGNTVVGRPRIIANILANPHWTCVVGSTPVPLLPRSFAVRNVEELVDEVLFASDRPITVVVFGERRRGKRSPVSPKALADRLAGLATVYYPRDGLAASTLGRYLGPDLAVETGMVRVFMPGLSRDDDPANHWAFFFETMERRGLGGREFADLLLSRLAERAVMTVPDSALLPLFRKKARDVERRRLEALRLRVAQEEAAAEELLQEYQERVDQLEAENEGLHDRLVAAEEAIERLQGELELAHLNIAELSSQLGRGPVDYAEPAPEPSARQTVDEIVRDLAGRLDHLEFLPSALKAAEDVPENYEFPERVEDILRRLDEAARVRNEQGGRMPRGWKQYFKQFGLRYKARISDTTRTNWGEEYTFTYDGERHLFQEHFTISAKDATKCLSIHFSTRLRDDRIVVAWVGRHLTNTQT